MMSYNPSSGLYSLLRMPLSEFLESFRLAGWGGGCSYLLESEPCDFFF